jgi:hypothetical protein
MLTDADEGGNLMSDEGGEKSLNPKTTRTKPQDNWN